MPPGQENEPLLWIIGGPNGSGKSTYYKSFISKHLTLPFINADHIAVELLGRHPKNELEMRRALKETEKRRAACFRQRRSFVMETVFSHPSKLELIRQAKSMGYMVRLSVICTRDPRLNVARVGDRITEGGHDVPLQKILDRYERALPLLAQACREANWAVVMDNTYPDKPFQKLVVFHSGRSTQSQPRLPKWAKVFK